MSTIEFTDAPSPGLDPKYAAALRQVLTERVANSGAPVSPPARLRRWWHGLTRRTAIGVIASASIALAGTAAYAIAVTLPGRTVTTPLAAPVTVVRSGVATMELGPRPVGVTSAVVEVSCLTAGRIGWPDGSSSTCSAADAATKGPPALSVLPLAAGQHTLTFTAGPDVRWQVTARYAASSETAWKVNSKGDTYGVSNSHGDPDLIAAIATNGRQGYVYRTTLDNAGGPPPTSPAEAGARTRANRGRTFTVPVYASDGTTQIGLFLVGP